MQKAEYVLYPQSVRGTIRCRDHFVTMFAEAVAIVNDASLCASSGYPYELLPLSPSIILTLHQFPNPPSGNIYTENDLLAYGQRRYRDVQYLAEQY